MSPEPSPTWLRLCVNVLLCLLFLTPAPTTHAQFFAPCGVVDALDYPIDISDTIAQQYDDFGRYRERFGGMHTGEDIGFRRWGDPVFAAARGLVTYSDPEGWDTEKGVVIVEHTFPDGSVVYSLYGHMEESDSIHFPLVGACVERGDVVGGIGWPSRGLPHLHYELRSILPTDGGPGYVQTNPLLLGWYHPLDFTQLWRARLAGGITSATTLESTPELAPAQLDSGQIVAALQDFTVEAVDAPNHTAWRVTTSNLITGLAALPGNRVVVHNQDGMTMTLQNGRYAAVWSVPGPDAPFVALGETLVFLTEGGGLAAFDSAGTELWASSGDGTEPDRIVLFEANGQTMALGVLKNGRYALHIMDASGTTIYNTALDGVPVAAPGPNGSWYLLDGANVDRIDGGTRRTLGTMGQVYGRAARLTVDLLGNSYIYLNDVNTTMLSLDTNGELRWRVPYPLPGGVLPPLMDTGSGCMLYTLDANGALNVFSTEDGAFLNQVVLYPGGSRTGNPRARLLRADSAEHVVVGAGFLSIATFDGHVLGGQRAATCLLG